MNWFVKVQVHLKLRKISPVDVQKWSKEKNIDLLIFTLNNGFYPERILAIKALTQLRVHSVISLLFNVAENDFETVAKVAISSLEILDEDLIHKEQIEKLKAHWTRKNQNRTIYKSNIRREWPDKKSRMKNLERLRQQLKTPIYGGKWI